MRNDERSPVYKILPSPATMIPLAWSSLTRIPTSRSGRITLISTLLVDRSTREKLHYGKSAPSWVVTNFLKDGQKLEGGYDSFTGSLACTVVRLGDMVDQDGESNDVPSLAPSSGHLGPAQI